MKLQFKFADKIGQAGRQNVIRALSKCGVDEPQPLLPGETDAELAALFVVNVPSQGKADEVLALLNKSPAIEFAEPEVRRKLIR